MEYLDFPSFFLLLFRRNIPFLGLKRASSGFTLLELMIVVIIIGVLSAVSIPVLIANVDKAKYAGAKTQMGCMGRELRAYQAEHGIFPPDVARNTPPFADSECFEVHEGYVVDNPTINQTHKTRIPFNSVYDYENWSSSSSCYVAITFFGKDGLRQFAQAKQNEITTPGFHKYQEDLVLYLGTFTNECP